MERGLTSDCALPIYKLVGFVSFMPIKYWLTDWRQEQGLQRRGGEGRDFLPWERSFPEALQGQCPSKQIVQINGLIKYKEASYTCLNPCLNSDCLFSFLVSSPHHQQHPELLFYHFHSGFYSKCKPLKLVVSKEKYKDGMMGLQTRQKFGKDVNLNVNIAYELSSHWIKDQESNN